MSPLLATSQIKTQKLLIQLQQALPRHLLTEPLASGQKTGAGSKLKQHDGNYENNYWTIVAILLGGAICFHIARCLQRKYRRNLGYLFLWGIAQLLGSMLQNAMLHTYVCANGVSPFR